MSKLTRSRSYCFTINNYTDDDMADIIIMSDNARYIVVGFEKGKDNTPHLQCYVYFENQILFTSVKMMIPRAHIEVARGSPQQNFDYCTKDGDFYEDGVLPVQGKLTWDKLIEVYNSPHEYPHLYTMYRKTIEEIKQRDIKKDTLKKTKFYVCKPIGDAITEIFNYFGWGVEDNVAVVNTLAEVETYDNPERVIYFADGWDKEQDLWPRGKPIAYKLGYLYKVIKPEILVIVTETPNVYPLYKKIICI